MNTLFLQFKAAKTRKDFFHTIFIGIMADFSIAYCYQETTNATLR
jgi:hypothetical protein